MKQTIYAVKGFEVQVATVWPDQAIRMRQMLTQLGYDVIIKETINYGKVIIK
jgi:Na+-transporting NADH:ubiquinone oxidoreductase subunit NqrB